MGYQRWIADSCRKWLPTEEYGGWTSRGSSSFNPGGVVDHWTAGPRGTTGRPSLNICVNGRAGIPGPLCNVYFDRNGIAVVVGAGRANHAGTGGYKGLSGNSTVLGIEAECAGDGDWTAKQRENYPRLVAALLSGIGRGAEWTCGHNEWTSRKIDIRDWPMSTMRSQVATLLSGAPTPPIPPTPPPEEVDVTPEQDKVIKETLQVAQAALAEAQRATVAATAATKAAYEATQAATRAAAEAGLAHQASVYAGSSADAAAGYASSAASDSSHGLWVASSRAMYGSVSQGVDNYTDFGQLDFYRDLFLPTG